MPYERHSTTLATASRTALIPTRQLVCVESPKHAVTVLVVDTCIMTDEAAVRGAGSSSKRNCGVGSDMLGKEGRDKGEIC